MLTLSSSHCKPLSSSHPANIVSISIMPSNLEARVVSLRKARSDQAVNSSRSTSKSTPVREPYSSWLERDGERVEEWLAEQKMDSARRRASVQEQTALAFLEVVEKTHDKKEAEPQAGGSKQQDKEPKMGIERRWTTGEVDGKAGVLTGVGAFAGDETPRYVQIFYPSCEYRD